ncbi:LuxR C-terminal-related transcriptional regulator [Actinomadura scrupuli]|uniref:LuxR C-terminal-related transcriptional regulator n=1 Tax=Actinomadura scrupuli TaxID=559629 RepID=UPI003D96C922
MIRSGLVALLGNEQGISVTGAVDCGKRLVAAGREHEPDVALIDVDLTDMDGFTATRILREKVPDCAVVIMAGRKRPGDLRRTVTACADGYVLKDTSPAELVDTIRRVARGERVIDANLAIAELSTKQSPLTPRELDVLEVAAEGATTGEIAERLFLSRGTVRNYLSRTLTKIGARTRVDAVAIAKQHGWLSSRHDYP